MTKIVVEAYWNELSTFSDVLNFLEQLTGSSEATAIEAIGKAEAERMRQKAAAYKMYGDAAMTALVLEALPKVAAEVAAPLAKTDQIVIVGDGSSGVTNEVSKLVSQLPPAVQALTGVDLSGVSEYYCLKSLVLCDKQYIKCCVINN